MEKKSVKRSSIKTKSYRIHEGYSFLLESCIQLYGELKTELFMTLVKNGKLSDSERFLSLPQYSKNDFIEHILNELKNTGEPLNNLKGLFNEVIQFQDYYDELLPNNTKVSVLLQTRIEPKYQEFIDSYSVDRIGEVIELAIANFINDLSEFEYELIGFLFNSKVDKALNEKYSKELPFKTHTIYLQFENQYYVLHQDLTKEPVEKIKKHSPKYPSVLLKQSEFENAKQYLLNKQNPHRLGEDAVKLYLHIGFITDNEYREYIGG